MGNILACSKEAGILGALAALPRSYRSRCTTVGGGTETIQAILRDAFAVAVLDLDADASRSTDLIDMVKRVDPSLPIVAIAADGSVEAERRAREQGALCFLVKPVDARELRMALDGAEGRTRRGRRG